MSESEIAQYCATYLIPRERLIDILEDQKVLPMIRGKATEYNAEILVRQVLSDREWRVEKLNLNPQPGEGGDEDVSVTFRRTGTRLGVETKNAVRASFRLRARSVQEPHFKVKLHRSRSNTRKATNDKYVPSDFDLIMCNVSNALFRSRALDPGIHLIENEEAIEWLREHYNTNNGMDLFREAYNDWRFCLPYSIAVDQDGTLVLPRTPTVLMENDPNWFTSELLHERLRTLINGVDRNRP